MQLPGNQGECTKLVGPRSYEMTIGIPHTEGKYDSSYIFATKL